MYLQSDRAIKVSAKFEDILQKDRFTTITVVLFLSLFILSLVYLVFAFTNLDYRVPSDAVTSMEQIKAYMYRLSPFVLWSALISGQTYIVLTYMGYATQRQVPSSSSIFINRYLAGVISDILGC